MGCFSYVCRKCGSGIRSTSLSGENVKLTLLEKGVVKEEMQGEYDSYGRVWSERYGKIRPTFQWEKDWNEIVNMQFGDDETSGISAIHVACLTENARPPKKRSRDDRNQGWGKLRDKHMGDCEVYHKIM